MIDTLLQVKIESGLHARPSSMIITRLQPLDVGEAFIERDGLRADLRSIMQVLTLACARGSTVRIRISGADEQRAFAIVEEILSSPTGGLPPNGETKE